MFQKEYDNFMVGVQHALSLPIRARCAELTVVLSRGSISELHSFFPVLIDNIFGPQGTVSWGLRTTTETQCEDFRQLQHFLSPGGPLFKLIYTLLKDINIRYEFPLIYLPTKVKQFLENNTGHPFYSELVNYSIQTKQPTSLLLNPFDYYIFHFAYHLINPWQQRFGSAVTSWNTVYYVLCCDYILHFLPTDPSTAILPQIYYNGKNPNKSSQINVIPTHSPIGSSSLINPILVNKSTDESFLKNLDRHHPRNEIWRSETVLTVFTDMWLHNDQVIQPAIANTMNSTFNKPSTVGPLHFNELPAGEYMRIVRVMIKQLHAFSASAKADDTSLSELKKIAIPMIQGKFYVFVRNLIHRWPLDGSFRLVLELWLTYIQPWRYSANNLVKQLYQKESNPDLDNIAHAAQNSVDKEFLPFIAENLLCYVVIFQQLIPRFCRVDLVSPKMSLMLYRITKVFDQPNLSGYLREVEQCVENNHPSPTHKYATEWSSSLPPLSPTTNWSTNTHLNTSHNETMMLDSSRHASYSQNVTNASYLTVIHSDKKWSAIVRQKIFELEGPTFCYKPLFSDPPAPEIYELIIQIKKSIRYAKELIKMKEEEERELYSGFWGSIKYLLHSRVCNDEFTLDDRKKVPIYLEVSYQNLVDMFNITEEICENEPEPVATANTSGFEMSNDFKFLTPERVRSRLKTIKYDGDPDLYPIRSDECAFLVRALYQLAQKINESFGPIFYQMYHRPTFWGRLSRQILCPPITTYKYDKSVVGSPRVSSNLPPRVSLRYFASYKFLGYFFFGAVIAWLLGHRFESYILFLTSIFLLYKSLRAIPDDGLLVRHNYPTQGFGNISFNDSFQ